MLLFVMLLLNSVFSPIQQARYIDVSISAFQKTFENLQFAWCFLSVYGDVMYQLNRSFNSPPPSTGGIPWAFDTFAVQGRREFDYQSLQGGGEFEP